MVIVSMDKNNPMDHGIETKERWFGVRHSQILLLFSLIFVAYGIRASLSVGIVAMTEYDVNPTFTHYNWTDKSTILSSFFWGYIVTQIGAGQLAERFGPKWFLTGTMSVCAVFSIAIPFMAALGSWGVMICRVIQGLTQGFFYPSCHNLLGRWVPLAERARLSNFVYAGGTLGTVVAMPVTGWIAESSLGWSYAFYLYGGLGLLWAAAWTVFGANSPAEHKTISEEEKAYILQSLDRSPNAKRPKTPWKSIFKSVPVWAILITHVGQNWGYWTLSTEIPTYMSSILKFNISQNGLLSACPYLIFWLLTFVFSPLSDLAINKRILSIGATRKIANSIGLYGPAIALIVLGWLTSSEVSKATALALLFVGVGINSACYSGYQLSHIDLSPNFAGTLMGITNAAAALSAILGPLAVQLIVTEENDASQWSTVFYIAGAIYIITNTIFVIFGSGEVQPWDSNDNTDTTDDTTDSKSDRITKVVDAAV